MAYLGNEETLVELPAVEYLEKNLGYAFAHGKDLTPGSGARDSLADVVLVDLNFTVEQDLYVNGQLRGKLYL